MTRHLLLLIILICNSSVFAGIYRAGEITYKNVSGLTYEITVTTYTDLVDTVGVPQITLYWGDGSIDTIPRSGHINLTAFQTIKNIFIGLHTYPGPATYFISFEDTFRTDGIVNIPNSSNVGFAIESVLTINPFLGVNNSPDFLNIPLDIAYLDSIFIYNSSVYDIDGDSISYKLIAYSIPGYTFPQATIIFSLDSLIGDLLWDSPMTVGDFNIAMLIEEWRYGVKIGSVVRDMQIHVQGASDLDSFSDNPSFNIFPNPTNDKLFLKSELNKITTIEMIDLNGKTILHFKLNNEQTIDISSFAKGVYLLRMTGDEITLTKKIIKE